MSVSVQRVFVILLLLGVMIGCVPANAPSQPTQALAPEPIGAPGPTRVHDVPLPPTPTQQAAAVPPTVEPTDLPVVQNPSSPTADPDAWSGLVTILHTNDSVGYLDPCG
jgi:hypothetical protein